MSEDAGALLKISGVAHKFKTVQALSDVSLTVGAGDALGLLGPNGSGKSTLLGLLTGQQKLQRGELRYRGASLASRSGWRAWASDLGVVFQSPALDPQLSARENLQLAGRMAGLTGASLEEAVDEGLVRAHVQDRASERLKTFSGGMRRRLDLSRALLHRPAVLVMDEPTTGLDEASFAGFWELVAEQRRTRGLTLLVATHRAEEAEHCDRVAVFRRGEVVAEDTPSALRSSLEPDVIEIESAEPPRVVEAVRQIDETLAPTVRDRSVRIQCTAGHELIPRLVEALPTGAVHAVSLHRASLADVFLHITGESLMDSVSPEAKR